MYCYFYQQFELYGIALGLIAFFLVLLFGWRALQQFHLNQRSILTAFFLSGLGHFIGAYAYFEYAVHIGADSCMYFHHATTQYQGSGFFFAFTVLGYARKYLLGKSFLGAFLLSGALAWLGSLYLVLAYRALCDRLFNNQLDARNTTHLVLPIFLLFCWPSYFFWSAGLIKDNFSFVGVAITLFMFADRKLRLGRLLMWTILMGSALIARPYLFVIFGVASLIYVLLQSKIKLSWKITSCLVIGVGFSLMVPVFVSYSHIANFNGSISLKALGDYAIRQQTYMSVGSSIPVPTHNPDLTFLFLPYLAMANLLLPLGYGASDMIGYIASLENFYLLFWMIWLISHWHFWKAVLKKLPSSLFLFIYFIVGISCLSMMSTNFGLAMREKMLYVPALLICIFLTYSYKKIQSQTNGE